MLQDKLRLPINLLLYFFTSRDHFFDTSARARGKRKPNKPFAFGELNDPLRGDEPVRQRYGYKVKDHTVYASKRHRTPFDVV